MNQSKDLRNMTTNELVSSMNKRDDIKLVDKYYTEFFTYLSDLTILELCDTYKISHINLATLDILFKRVEASLISGILQKKEFYSVPIKSHYRINGMDIFPFCVDSFFYCENCKDYHCNVMCIYVTQEGTFGITILPLDERFSFIDDNIHTFKDLWLFMCKNTDVEAYPILI